MLQFTPSPVLSIRTELGRIDRDLARLPDIIPPAEIAAAGRILVKINLCDARTPETGTISDPRFIDALLGWLRTIAPKTEIALTESDGVSVFADRFRTWFGIDEVLAKWDAGWVNLSDEPTVDVPIAGRFLDHIAVPEALTTSFVISLSKLKTNLLSTITCALKNQFGCLPMIDKFKYHTDLSDVIHDVNQAIRPGLFIVDGIVAHGGIQGPSFGTPIRAGIVLAGRDPVAVDAVCCKVLGYNPMLVGHVRKSAMSGRGSLRYSLVGDPLPKVDFENRGFEIQVFRIGGKLKRFYQRQARARSDARSIG